MENKHEARMIVVTNRDGNIIGRMAYRNMYHFQTVEQRAAHYGCTVQIIDLGIPLATNHNDSDSTRDMWNAPRQVTK